MSAILRVEHLHKEYPGVVAVDDISFEVHAGEVLALMGENGAGKSTVSKMIFGVEKPDAGEIYMNDEKMNFNSPQDAKQHGINMVHQELTMMGHLNVAENIFVNRQPTNVIGAVKWKEMYAETKRLLDKFNLQLDPKTPVSDISTGSQQLLEIVRVTSMDSKVVILDEPTSSLAEDQIELLFDIVRQLKSEGYGFIYISHKLDEIFAIADRVLVMRDGKYIGEAMTSELDSTQLVTMMVGREITQLYGDAERTRKIDEKPFLEVESLGAEGLYHDVSFDIKKGEIVGVAGLIGAGRTEMALGIFGAHHTVGTIKVNGEEVHIKSPAEAINRGIAYLTEDRKQVGLFLEYTITQNMIAPRLAFFTKHGILQKKEFQAYAQKQVDDFGVATPSINQVTGNLSGGNQQKCLVAEWLGVEPELLIIDEPTRGVDVGAKADIYQMLKEYADSGHAVLVISSEMVELIGICDRILVMCEGTLTGEVQKEDFSEDTIMKYATGIMD